MIHVVPREVPQHCSDLVPGQHHGEALWLLGAHHVVQPAYILVEELLIQKTLDAPLGPFNQDELALGRFETQGFRIAVFFGVVPALGLFEAWEFEDHHTFGLPIAFEGLDGAAPYYVAPTVLLNRRGYELTIFLKPSRIGDFEIDDEIHRHGCLPW